MKENKERLKIGIDIDDVLLDLIGTLSEYHNFVYGTSLTKEDFHTFYFNEVWGGTLEQAIFKAYQFVESPFFDKMKVIPFAQKAISFLKKDHYLVNITSRLESSEKKTAGQIHNFFGGAFSEIHFTNEWVKDRKKSKQDVCSDLSLNLFIDDSLENVKKCSSKGINCFLFGNYKWNQCFKEDLPDNVSRVENWKEALIEIKKLEYHNEN